MPTADTGQSTRKYLQNQLSAKISAEILISWFSGAKLIKDLRFHITCASPGEHENHLVRKVRLTYDHFYPIHNAWLFLIFRKLLIFNYLTIHDSRKVSI